MASPKGVLGSERGHSLPLPPETGQPSQPRSHRGRRERLGTPRVALQLCSTTKGDMGQLPSARGACCRSPRLGVGSQALTERRKLLVESQAGLQPRPQQLHRQLHVAGAQRVVRSDRVLWAGGAITAAPACGPPRGTPRSGSHPPSHGDRHTSSSRCSVPVSGFKQSQVGDKMRWHGLAAQIHPGSARPRRAVVWCGWCQWELWGLGQDTTIPQSLPQPQLRVPVEREGAVTCLRLILGEMQAAQLLHPHVGVPQLGHIVAQGQDAAGTMRNSYASPEQSPLSPHHPACEPAGGSRNVPLCIPSCARRAHPTPAGRTPAAEPSPTRWGRTRCAGSKAATPAPGRSRPSCARQRPTHPTLSNWNWLAGLGVLLPWSPG